MFIVGFRLRFWCDCENGFGINAVIIHSCGICNATVSSSGSGNVVGGNYFGLYGGNMAWGVFLQYKSWGLSS